MPDNMMPISPSGTRPWGGESPTIDQTSAAHPNDDDDETSRTADDFGGFGSKEVRRRALGSSLLQAGSQILAGASTGDFAGGLARGAQAFSGTFSEERDRASNQMRLDREEQRRQAEDARQAAEDARAAESHDLGMETGREQLDDAKERRLVAAEIRERTGKGAEHMAADIRALAAAHPDNQKLQVMARRAEGYSVGDADDVDKLTSLHDQMTSEAFWQSDADREASTRRQALRGDIAAGVAPDPKAAERRANAELGISQGHLALARERAAQDKDENKTKQLTTLQAFDRIQKSAMEKFNRRMAAERDSRGEPTPGLREKLWSESLQEAQTEFRSLQGVAYQYTANGELIPQ